MKHIKFAGEQEPDDNHNKEGKQERVNILSRMGTGGRNCPFGVIGLLEVLFCSFFNIQ
jgi:hypothetical protein